MQKGMAIHSSVLAWRILRTEKPGGVQSMGLQRVGHNLATNTFTFVTVSFRMALFDGITVVIAFL